jgi:signal transduction histidine kinase
MSVSFKSGLLEQGSANPEVVAAHLRAYAERHRMLGAKRLLIFAVALVLQAFFVGEEYVAVSTILIVLSEAFDSRTAKHAVSLRADLPASVRAVLRRVHMGVLYSSLMISFFALSIAFAAAGGNSFIAMLYLLAAAVFAAMNTHQLSSALVIRLCVYGVAALVIPFADVLLAEGLFGQTAWLTFLTSLFVFYFIIDGSMIGLRYYRTNSQQLAQLRAENARTIKALDEKAQVLSMLREEVRTSLTSIRASLNVAGMLGPMPQNAIQALNTTQRDAARLTTQIDELLDFHEVEMNEMTFDFCDVQLARLIAGQ